MRILKLYPSIDIPSRFNYSVNYGVWDAIEGTRECLETFDGKLDGYDFVFLPQSKRWANLIELIDRLKSHKIKVVLFENDSCYYDYDNKKYRDIDYLFYRDLDKNGKMPKIPSSFLNWSIDTDRYVPKYGGSGVSFNCSCNSYYPLRQKISKVIKPTSYTGDRYITHLQNSAAAIHTDSDLVPAVRGKILEYAACGTQIISNRTQRMEEYFPHELITYFHDVDDLIDIVRDFKPDIEVQKMLRKITEEKHDNKVRAKEVIQILNTI